MYKVLIADDEQIIRQGLMAKLAKFNYEYAPFIEAFDGEDALNKIKLHQPDIVFIDIRMPFINGLDVIEQIRQLNYHTQFILISGYAEFKYAERAINMDVNAYVLKPISMENLEKALHETIRKLTIEQENRTIKTVHEKAVHDNLAFQQGKEIHQLLANTFQADNYESKLNRIGLPLDENYILGILHINDESFSNSGFSYRDIALLKFSISNIIEKVNYDNFIYVVENNSNKTELYLLFHHKDSKHLLEQTKSLIDRIFIYILHFLKIQITIGTSLASQRVEPKLAYQAKAALDEYLIHGINKVYAYDDFNNRKIQEFPIDKIRLFEKNIEKHNTANAKTIAISIFDSIRASHYSTMQIKQIYQLLLNAIILKNAQSDSGINRSLIDEILATDVRKSFHSVDQIKEHLLAMIDQLLEGESKQTSNIAANYIQEAETYIQNNYFNAITTEKIADVLCLNPSYFSTLFKEKKGITVTKYITNLRLEKAVDLLANSDAHVSDIASIIGFNDPRYFSKVFKKYKGITPLEFRKNHAKRND